MKNAGKPSFALLLFLVVATGSIACAARGAFAGAKSVASRVRLNVDQLPLHFIENAGQVDAQVRYYVQGSDKTFYFTARGVTLAMEERGAFRDTPRLASIARDPPHAANEQRRIALRLDFIGANRDARPVGEEQAPALVSYFKGPQEQWKTGLKTYKKLVYRDVWPGIDLIYSGTVKRLKYMFVVKPGANPDLIKLAYRGADTVSIDADGRLEVRTALGGFHDERPTAYQPTDGEQAAVNVSYQRHAAGAESFAYGFRVASYDESLPLVIDPAILIYAGFIGGSGLDRGNAVAVDTSGSAYVTGETSSVASFPEKTGPDLTHNGGIDAFIAKVAADGQTLIYAGFIGGAGSDRGMGIAVDGAENAYVVGETNSGVNFPAAGGLDQIHNGLFDAFVAKLNANGTALLYAGFVGGSGDDRGNAIAIEQGCASDCAVYIAGETNSSEGSFPDTAGPDVTHNFAVDAFVAKVNAAGSALVYAGYIGGSGTDRGKGIAVDGDGNAYVTGETNSSGTSFPDGNGFGLVPGFAQVENGALDAFVVKVNPAGTALVYGGFLGGSGDDRGNAIAIEPGCASNCAAYLTGETSSDQDSFPVVGGPDLSHNGGVDAFVAKVAANGSSLVYAGYIGGANDDRGNGIAIDSSDGAHVTGETNSDQATFPDSVGPDLTHNGLIDAFVAQVNTAGNALVYAGFIGGLGSDHGKGIALDSNGGVYVVGDTNSDQVSFPKKIGPDTTQNGDFDAFVAKICVSACADVSVAVTDAPDPVRVGENLTYTITITNDGPDTATNVIMTVTVPSTVGFVSSVPGAPACVFTVTLDCNLGDLNNGVSTVVTLVVGTTARGVIHVSASATADETDTDPSNNEDRATTSATLSNLVVLKLDADGAVLPGDTITINDTTFNNGRVDGNAISFTHFHLSSDRRFDAGDMLLGSRMIPALVKKASNSGSTVSLPIPGATSLGRYFIIALADATNTNVETREGGQKTRVLLVTRPDLVISALRAPGKAPAGGSITITDTTLNNSPLPTVVQTTTTFFLSSDAVFDAGDVSLGSRTMIPPLPDKGKSSDSTTVTIPGGTAPGKYFLIAVADSSSPPVVDEADEANNARARRITVTP